MIKKEVMKTNQNIIPIIIAGAMIFGCNKKLDIELTDILYHSRSDHHGRRCE